MHAATDAARPVEDHYAEVVKALLAGRLVPVLGTGVNRDGAIPGLDEIAGYLADSFDYPPANRDLARVSEYVALMKGVGPLYDELHDLLDRDYDAGPVHRALAELAAAIGAHDAPRQLIVTTNYDVALERAFAEAGERLDVVSYISLGRHHGRFLHVSAEGEGAVVDVPNAYTGLSLDDRTVVLKLLGQVDRRPEREWESFAVTEDDHIDYLAQADITSLVPVTLVARLRRSHFLFLGYPLRDWGLRVFLHRIWGREKVAYQVVGRGGLDRTGRARALAPAWCRRVRRAARRVRRGARLSGHRGGARVTEIGCPYKGLASFDDSDADAGLFFGRDREREIICANLMASKLTVLYGDTGVGKSSVLRAGVARTLRSEGDPLRVVVFDTLEGRPGERARDRRCSRGRHRTARDRSRTRSRRAPRGSRAMST